MHQVVCCGCARVLCSCSIGVIELKDHTAAVLLAVTLS